jgi:hypothetical protein
MCAKVVQFVLLQHHPPLHQHVVITSNATSGDVGWVGEKD